MRDMMYNKRDRKPHGKGGDMHSFIDRKSNIVVRAAVCLLISFALIMAMIYFGFGTVFLINVKRGNDIISMNC